MDSRELDGLNLRLTRHSPLGREPDAPAAVVLVVGGINASERCHRRAQNGKQQCASAHSDEHWWSLGIGSTDMDNDYRVPRFVQP